MGSLDFRDYYWNPWYCWSLKLQSSGKNTLVGLLCYF